MNQQRSITPKGYRRLRTTCRKGHPIEHSRMNPQGYMRCRDCERISRNRYYNRHKETRSVINALNDRRLRHKRRQKILSLFGGKCVRCGFSDWRALQIDHKFGGGGRKSKGWSQSKLFSDVRANMGEYQLLCANCNAIKKIINKEDTHRY